MTKQSTKFDAAIDKCEACEGHRRIYCSPDNIGETHPCDTCDPEGYKAWQDEDKNDNEKAFRYIESCIKSLQRVREENPRRDDDAYNELEDSHLNTIQQALTLASQHEEVMSLVRELVEINKLFDEGIYDYDDFEINTVDRITKLQDLLASKDNGGGVK